MNATVNTLRNSAQETVVDGMARERQQYSGDGGHQLHAIRYMFGETRLPERFLRTFSTGLTQDGYFLDSWPAFDRLSRIAMRQFGLSEWGPILDHGVGFVFDCWHHFMYTGNDQVVKDIYPRLVRFADYLLSRRDRNGLLPVENLGVPVVWMDHQAYKKQRHKTCAFNLYVAAMLRHALSPMARLCEEKMRANIFEQIGDSLEKAVVGQFWSDSLGLFVNNLPWLEEEGGEKRLCDRSLATAVLFGQCPMNNTVASIEALASRPLSMGLSYPCNAGWRYWALAQERRTDVVVREMREIWATMPSVRLNNTLQEDWTTRSDSTDQWSHSAVVPIYILAMSLIGLRPTMPGFSTYEIRPQLGDIGDLDVVVHTANGPIRFIVESQGDVHKLCVKTPSLGQGEIILRKELLSSGTVFEKGVPDETVRIPLKPGEINWIQLEGKL